MKSTESGGEKLKAGIVAVAYISALANIFPNVQPLLLGALADHYALGDASLGQLNAAFIAATMVTGISAPFWIARIDWRKANNLAIAGAVAALLIGMSASTLGALLILFASIGLFIGTLSPTSFAALGETVDPNRSYAIGVTFQSALAAASTLLLSVVIIPQWGAPGMFASLAILVASGFLVARWHPRSASIVSPQLLGEDVPRQRIFSRAALPAILILVAIAMFIGAMQGYWTYVERIGVTHGVSHAAIGATLSLCAVATILNSAVVAWIGDRVPAVVVIVAGTIIVNVAFFCLSFPGVGFFIASNILFSSAFGLLVPSYWAILKEVDATDRIFVAGPAATSVGAIAVSLAAGSVIAAGGYLGLTIFDAILTISAALIAAAVAAALRIQRSRAVAHPA